MAHSVLKSVSKKYRNEPDKLTRYGKAIKQQLNDGIIEEVDIKSVINDPNAYFLAHNAVFRNNSSSTTCMIVFLYHLRDKSD